MEQTSPTHRHLCRVCGLLAALAPLLSSCIDYADTTPAVSVAVQLSQPSVFTTSTALGGHTVTMTGTRSSTIATTGSDGTALFPAIAPDVYTVSASWEVSSAEYLRCINATDTASDAGNVTIAGSLLAQPVMSDATMTLALRPVFQMDIVIGKVYYAGSKDNNGKLYTTGYYMELFNQSERTVDMGGLYIAFLETESPAQAYTLANLHEQHNDSVVLAKQIFRVPRHANAMVPAGGSLLLCNSAVDHSAGNSMEHSLLDADFEAKDANGRITNNPAVPALELVYSCYDAMTTMNFTKAGPCGVVIFSTGEDVTSWPRTYKYPNTATSGRQWVLLPKRCILDGVDILKYKATGIDVTTKRLYDDIDATYANILTASGNTGEVIYRKTARIADGGRIVLQDTNNSLEDFQISTTIKPREYDH